MICLILFSCTYFNFNTLKGTRPFSVSSCKYGDHNFTIRPSILAIDRSSDLCNLDFQRLCFPGTRELHLAELYGPQGGGGIVGKALRNGGGCMA